MTNAPVPHAAPQDIERFVVSLHRRYGLSEGVLPEQRASVVADFVEPRLMLVEERRRVEWGEMRRRRRLLVTGPAGAGKTTLLRNWMLRQADRSRSGGPLLLPLCLSLRTWSGGTNVESALRREAMESGAPWLARDLRQHARAGTLSLAFDGLDEAPDQVRHAAAEGIADFAERFPACPILLTARSGTCGATAFDLAAPGLGEPAADGSRMTHLRLLPFDRRRTRQFAYHRLFETGAWKSFASRIEAAPWLAWIAANPLALSLVAARFQRGEIGPESIGEIFADLVDLFTDRWDSSRGVRRAPPLSPRRRQRLLALVASGAKGVAEPALLAGLAVQTGLLTPRRGDGWGFASAGLREYFRALASFAGGKRAETLHSARNTGTPCALETALLGFLAAEGGAPGDPLLPAEAPAPARAAALTALYAQDLPAGEGALADYAAVVVRALAEPLAAASCRWSAGGHLALTVPAEAIAPGEQHLVDALVRALHRSRGGPGAEALRRAAADREAPHLAALAALLAAEGRMGDIRAAGRQGWEVRPILPTVPEGPGG